jgi:hypothetical protein
MRQLLTLLVAFLFIAGAPQQKSPFSTIKGKITDKGTGEPIYQATIIVVGSQRGTLSDIDGNYSIQIWKGSFTLKVYEITHDTVEEPIVIDTNGVYVRDFVMESAIIFDSARAERDIARGKPALLYPCGEYDPLPTFVSESFLKKYHLLLRCSQPPGTRQYHAVVYKYLDKKYGKAWRHEINLRYYPDAKDDQE